MGVSSNPSLRGDAGENITMNKLKEMYPNVELEDMHKVGHEGDYHM